MGKKKKESRIDICDSRNTFRKTNYVLKETITKDVCTQDRYEGYLNVKRYLPICIISEKN